MTKKKLDMQDVLGQEHCKRALEVAAVGDHSILLIGPHKSGKWALGERFSTIYSKGTVLFKIRKEDVCIQNNTARNHKGVMIATMLPCPCGNFTDPKKECNCRPGGIQKHLEATPSEILNRVDIHVEVPKLNLDHLSDRRRGESSEEIKARVEKARMNPEAEKLDKEADELLKLAILELGISAKSYDKIISVAATIAQMDDKRIIEAHHISEAISYRSLDRNLWG